MKLLEYFATPEIAVGGKPAAHMYRTLRRRARRRRCMALFTWILMIVAIIAGIGIFLFSRFIDDYAGALNRSGELNRLMLERASLASISQIEKAVLKAEEDFKAYLTPGSFIGEGTTDISMGDFSKALKEAFTGGVHEARLKIESRRLEAQLSAMPLTVDERKALDNAAEKRSIRGSDSKFFAVSEITRRVAARAKLIDDQIKEIIRQQNDIQRSGNVWVELLPTLSIRIGSIILILFLVRILAPIHQYYIKLAVFYDASADSIMLRTDEGAEHLLSMAQIALPEHQFGTEPRTPTQEIAEPVANGILKKLEKLLERS